MRLLHDIVVAACMYKDNTHMDKKNKLFSGFYPLTTSLPVCTNLVTKGSIFYDQLALCMAGQFA